MSFSCGAQALENAESVIGVHWPLVAACRLRCPGACGILVPWTRDQTQVPCTGRQILSHWTTREVPRWKLKPCEPVRPLAQGESQREENHRSRTGHWGIPVFKKWEGGEACEISEKDPTNTGKASGQSGVMKAKETGNLKKERWEDSKTKTEMCQTGLVASYIAQEVAMKMMDLSGWKSERRLRNENAPLKKLSSDRKRRGQYW